ncbi:hypothetical protein CRE_07332 [Caenorhabditis remanei]|uniref:Uncharacterized protein n=1 Tax=Caenorhabditis remanei TaxID=31234 RepID=E3M283_CAERE|nr:hypothetical protein CRE_07332 [Caenorhabditis remanei]
MVDRDRDYLNPNSPTRNPNVQRSTSFVGARLHFSYSGNETKTSNSSRQDPSNPKVSDSSATRSSRLPRQSTFDYSHLTNVTPSSTFLSPETSRRSTYVYGDSAPRENTESPAVYEPRTNTSHITREVPYLYGEASSAPKSHLSKDITLTTSSTLLPSSSSLHSPTRNLIETPPLSAPTSQYTRNYGNSSYTAYSAYDPTKRVIPADTSPRIPAPPPPSIPQHSKALQPVPIRRSPSPARRTQPVIDRTRRQTTAVFPSQTTFLSAQEYNPTSSSTRLPVQTTARTHYPALKPQSLNTQMQNTRLPSPQSRNLTIGYSESQRQDIERAQEQFRSQIREKEIKAKLEAKRAEEQARLEERKRIEEAAKLEARKRVEESARLDAERLALEAVMRAAHPDEDEDVEKFIRNLEQRIQDSRDSKNLKGALVGRQSSQNLAKNAENLTNALNEIDETVEGRDADDQRNMKTDENQNRRKYAETMYDPEDDDSELNSLNSSDSFLSTVPEEDPDVTSLDNQSFTCDPQPTTLQPRVISYIHNMVDGILSSLDKTDFANIIDTHQMPQLYDQDLYSNDASYNYNYRAISETARQFFTPKSSPVEETRNDFYNDSL